MQLEHACNLLLASELFEFHSDRMSHLLLDEAVANTNPHAQLILHKTLLQYGRAHQPFLRSKTKWAPLLPILMDHVLVSVDFDSLPMDRRASVSLAIPIEARLMTLAVGILYEVCRVQKFDILGLRMFDDGFIEALFDLVEDTRCLADETLNYGLIKLILALNEQFMVAALPGQDKHAGSSSKSRNRVLQVLIGRGGHSKTFAENVIFMLNRAETTEEDLCMQLLILKILYLLFTTTSTHEYFYTNDLCVLVDVFLRALANLPDESDSLRHTYLRVLNPLLTNTQLRGNPYKHAQIAHTLQGLVGHSHIREISPTTRRLVERCLSADWCKEYVQHPTPADRRGSDASIGSPTSPSSLSSFSSVAPSVYAPPLGITKSLIAPHPGLKREKSLRSSASASDLKAAAPTVKRRRNAPPVPQLGTTTPPNNSSMANLATAKHGASTGRSHSKNTALGVQHPHRGVSLGEVTDSLQAFTIPDAVALDSDSASSAQSTPLRISASRPRADSLSVPPSFELPRGGPHCAPASVQTPSPPDQGRSSPYRPAPPPPTGHRRRAPAPPSKAVSADATTAAANGHSLTTIAYSRPSNTITL